MGNGLHEYYSVFHTDLCVYNFKTNFIKLFKKLDYVIIEVNLKYLLPESFLQSLLWNEEEIFWFS